MSFSPWGPWYTVYIADMLASSAWAVQMLLVALSRLICCSLVCKASRYASWPLASLCVNCIIRDNVILRMWNHNDTWVMDTHVSTSDSSCHIFWMWFKSITPLLPYPVSKNSYCLLVVTAVDLSSFDAVSSLIIMVGTINGRATIKWYVSW